MLEGLDRIDWDRLAHAYGPAGDVPGWIRSLASADAEARGAALDSLRATICHQGSRYRASAPAVPFLFEILEAPGAPGKAGLIRLLEGLAVGYPEWHVPLGFDPAGSFAEADELGGPEDLDRIRSADPDEDEDDEPPRQALWRKDAYEAVLARLGAFRDLTRDADPQVRIAAVKALAWFPSAAPESARLVGGIARGRPAADELAGAILCLGILGRSLGDESDVPWLSGELAPDRPPPVRSAAAISLAAILGPSAPPGCLGVLLDAIQDPQQIEAEAAMSWHWLGPVAHACAAILLINPPADGPTLSALCRAAERVREPMAGAEVFRALLAAVIPDPSALGTDPRTGFRRFDPPASTPEQRRALLAIGRAPVWDAEPYSYGCLMDVGLEYGLPWHPAPYRELLEEIRRSAPGG